MTKKRSRPPVPAAKKQNFGPAGEAIIEFLSNLNAAAYDETRPLSCELAYLADSLAAVRLKLRQPGLTILETTRLHNLEFKLSEAFRKCWKELGLSETGSIYGATDEKVSD